MMITNLQFVKDRLQKINDDIIFWNDLYGNHNNKETNKRIEIILKQNYEQLENLEKKYPEEYVIAKLYIR